MNERIQELAEQAWNETAVSPDFGHPVTFAERLAESIIRDVLNFVEDEETKAGGDWRCKDGWNIYLKIRERYKSDE